MALSKHFTPSDWDADVPEERYKQLVLIPSIKFKKKKKNSDSINLKASVLLNSQDKNIVPNTPEGMLSKNGLKKQKHKDKSHSKTSNTTDSKSVTTIHLNQENNKRKIKKQVMDSGNDKKIKTSHSEESSPREYKKRKGQLDVGDAPKVKKVKLELVPSESKEQKNIIKMNPQPLTKTEKNRKRRRKKNKFMNPEMNGSDNKILHNNSHSKESVKLVKKPKSVKSDNENHEMSNQLKSKLSSSPKQVKNKFITTTGSGAVNKHTLKNKLTYVLALNENSDRGTIVENSDQKTDKKKRIVSQPKTLRERMLEKLKGARFRFINEQMYSKESKDAKRLFNEDPNAFSAYHDGYRHQVSKWPLNPLDIIIKDISKLPKQYSIADLGCGDARLAKSLPHKVHSLDLVSLDPDVQACDMAHTPLLSAQVNVVVFCLSLMGTNLKDYIIEANRILKIGGTMKIAEVESRFDNVEEFTKNIQMFGFKLIKSDLTQNLFYFMDFTKETDIVKRNKLPQLTLKPCLYKKR